ncbi:MAG: hypothetical protein COV47_04960 [Candidatus Diapherotrites archaeon CG11_big_fil_rev_8_21_14_0_20_37_9]|nr:MAG: hypothetical protein COV47_04960 [Candidatus Diapherotrites archaeon CG11_big_fil_rev_8_21_14_0_20_37_9]
MKLFALILVGVCLILSGCPESPSSNNYNYNSGGSQGSNYYADPYASDYSNSDSSGSSGSSVNCGGFESDCCEWFGNDEFGSFTARYYCDEGLECRAGICVEGPEHQAYNRTNGWS